MQFSLGVLMVTMVTVYIEELLNTHQKISHDIFGKLENNFASVDS